jgi:5-oxoprolinase (ATP-hydrolysing)/N-methylhydantoinase A
MIIGEAQDFGCELMNARGETLAHSPRSMPVFNLTLPRAVKALLGYFPPETLEEGDVLITNDPWICAGHLFDVAVVTPVFRGKGIVGLVGSIAHCSDIGGTRDTMSVREIYEEGLQIPPMKLYRRGEPNDDLLRLVRQNVRSQEMVLGDIHAQVGANGVAAERLVAFMHEYGLDDLSELAAVVQDRAERAMREAIAAVSDGEYFGSARPVGARRDQLHSELHRGPHRLRAQVHPDTRGALQRRLLPSHARRSARRQHPQLQIPCLCESADRDGLGMRPGGIRRAR